MNLTIMLVFGSYGGFYVNRWRICLGWVALSMLDVDIENCLEELIARDKACHCKQEAHA